MTKKNTADTTPQKAPALRLQLVRDRLKALPSYPRLEELPPSKAVLKAKAVVKQYEEADRKHRNRQRDAYFDRKRAVEDAMILGDFDKALRLLHALEADCRKDGR